MLVLDTNIVSDLRRPEKTHPNLVAWADAQPVASLFISVITLWELEIGAQLKERSDPAQGQIIRTWLDQRVKPQFEGRVLPFDSAVAMRCASLRVPNPRSVNDSFIAATALVHGMKVVTRNIDHFKGMVALINPFDPI